MLTKSSKIISIVLIFLLIFEQSGFAQVETQNFASLHLSTHLASFHNTLSTDKYRPLHLRYLGYDAKNNDFELLLDKGDYLKEVDSSQKSVDSKKNSLLTIHDSRLIHELNKLMEYFFIGLSLPNESFWVNLRPDSEDNVIDSELAKTDIGKILLEADVQLKKDTALYTSPQTTEGKKYWDKLYEKAEELYGYDNITIPTLTRPWIVPGEIIIRETPDNAYIYKATLKVMLEEDYFKKQSIVDSPLSIEETQELTNSRTRELNIYSTQLIKELIIPKLTKEVNTSRKYANLRQVYYSLILAQWFKNNVSLWGASATKPAYRTGRQSFNEIASPSARNDTAYIRLINSGNLTGLTSKIPWSKETYYREYQKSFKDGEYNLKEQIPAPFSAAGGGQIIRSYFSGGMSFDTQTVSSAIQAGMVVQGKSNIDFPNLLVSSVMNNNILTVVVSGDGLENIRVELGRGNKEVISLPVEVQESNGGIIEHKLPQDLKAGDRVEDEAGGYSEKKTVVSSSVDKDSSTSLLRKLARIHGEFYVGIINIILENIPDADKKQKITESLNKLPSHLKILYRKGLERFYEELETNKKLIEQHKGQEVEYLLDYLADDIFRENKAAIEQLSSHPVGLFYFNKFGIPVLTINTAALRNSFGIAVGALNIADKDRNKLSFLVLPQDAGASDDRHEFHHFIWNFLTRSEFVRSSQEITPEDKEAFSRYKDEFIAYLLMHSNIMDKDISAITLVHLYDKQIIERIRYSSTFVGLCVKLAEKGEISVLDFIYAASKSRNFNELEDNCFKLVPFEALRDIDIMNVFYQCWFDREYLMYRIVLATAKHADEKSNMDISVSEGTAKTFSLVDDCRFSKEALEDAAKNIILRTGINASKETAEILASLSLEKEAILSVFSIRKINEIVSFLKVLFNYDYVIDSNEILFKLCKSKVPFFNDVTIRSLITLASESDSTCIPLNTKSLHEFAEMILRQHEDRSKIEKLREFYKIIFSQCPELKEEFYKLKEKIINEVEKTHDSYSISLMQEKIDLILSLLEEINTNEGFVPVVIKGGRLDEVDSSPLLDKETKKGGIDGPVNYSIGLENSGEKADNSKKNVSSGVEANSIVIPQEAYSLDKERALIRQICNWLFFEEDPALNLRYNPILQLAGEIDREYVIEYKTREIPVLIFEAPHNLNRKVAYINRANWGNSVLVPINFGVDIYTKDAFECPLLIMRLVDKNNNSYIFLSHIYSQEITTQINRIIEILKDMSMIPKEIVFSPNGYSKYGGSEEILEKFLGKKLIKIQRNWNTYGTKTLVTEKGWVIAEDVYYLGDKQNIYSKLWEETEYSSDICPYKNDLHLVEVVSSSLPAKETKKGGIDFHVMPIVTQAVISSQNFSAVSSGIVSSRQPPTEMSGQVVEARNDGLDKRWQEIERMVNAGIMPSIDHVKECLVSSCVKGDFDGGLDKIIGCFAGIFRLEECLDTPADSELKQILVLLESDKPANELELALR